MRGAREGVGRRGFLRAVGGAAAAALCAAGGGHAARAEDAEDRRALSSGMRIVRASAWRVRAERWKVVGKNARLGVHGKFAQDRILVLETNAGITGFGSSRAPEEAAARLIGTDPLVYYKPGRGIESPLGRSDMPLWDLCGRILGEPLWRLFGGYGAERVPVYDGSIYFSDLEPEYRGRGIARLLEEVDHGLEEGHRAFKIKVGRGFKWMEREAGLKRDIEVVRAIRRHVGPEVKLMVDANNGYDPALARRFLEGAGVEFFFVEELFEESVEEDLALKKWLRGRGWKTLVADGESARGPEHFEPYIEARALDVLQGDVRAFGFNLLLRLSRRTAQTGIRLAPHNWGSVLGLYMQLALGRGIPNFLIAEKDPAATDLFAAEGFELRDGLMTVPEKPGSGLELRLEALRSRTKPDWVLA